LRALSSGTESISCFFFAHSYSSMKSMMNRRRLAAAASHALDHPAETQSSTIFQGDDPDIPVDKCMRERSGPRQPHSMGVGQTSALARTTVHVATNKVYEAYSVCLF
jgi:hypothetical protein